MRFSIKPTRELVQLYRGQIEQSTRELTPLLDEIAKAEREYTSAAFEILKSDADKLNALYHSLNAAIYLENIAADRAAAGGPPETHLGAKAQRLEAQMRIAKFKRTMSAGRSDKKFKDKK